MATKIQNFLLLLLLLLAFEEMMIMRVESALCEASSKLFRGLCFSDRNCEVICEKEGFVNGHCRFLKCICSKDCNIGGGGGGGGDGPPEDGPPGGGEGPPGDSGPPDEGSPGGEEPPADSGAPDEGPPGVLNKKSWLN